MAEIHVNPLDWMSVRRALGDIVTAHSPERAVVYADCTAHAIVEDARAACVRAVVAAQWAVACVLFHQGLGEPGSTYNPDAGPIAALPTAEQIVDGVA